MKLSLKQNEPMTDIMDRVEKCRDNLERKNTVSAVVENVDNGDIKSLAENKANKKDDIRATCNKESSLFIKNFKMMKIVVL